MARQITVTDQEIFTSDEMDKLLKMVQTLARADEDDFAKFKEHHLKDNPLIKILSEVNPTLTDQLKEEFVKKLKKDYEVNQKEWRSIEIKLHLLKYQLT